MKYFILAFKKAFDFNARANRPEYWYFTLFSTIFSLIFMGIDTQLLGASAEDIGITGAIFSLVTFIPSLSVSIRRLHDVNKSGWNLLWFLTIIGVFYILYLHIIKGTDGSNNYGDPSKE
tara:strand:- start:204 stop:560 length:357 start_codon:yes stop_codon:yes gene_type:complete